MSAPSNRVDKNGADDRRNLYVLGLPFALTKSAYFCPCPGLSQIDFKRNEFASIFAQYGTVSHCVILATVDNSSRRRGFVVMSTHDEARRSMACLTRTLIKYMVKVPFRLDIKS
jgi:RNA recognition motif-containing protein